MKKSFIFIMLMGYIQGAPASQPTPLIDAVWSNDLARVKELIASGKANFNERYERFKMSDGHYLESFSPLELAASHGYLPIVEVLVKAGADINSGGGQPLAQALGNVRRDVAEFLIRAGAHMNKEDHSMSAIEIAANWHDLLPVLKLLLESRKFDALDMSNALVWASMDENTAGVELLLKHGASAHHKHPWNQQTALMYVKDAHIVDLLIKAGADINAQDYSGFTPLIKAVARGTIPVIEPLLRAGADVTVKDNEGWTAFDYAEYIKNTQVKAQVKALLTKAMQKKK